MAWRRATFKDKQVWVEVDAQGAPLVRRGLVPTKYALTAGAKVYQATAANVAVDPEGPLEEPPAGGGSGRGSGFGKAGTRTKEQAAAAVADARGRIAALPEGTVVCFTDGACKGNPGPAGSGVLLRLPDGRAFEASRALGHATNNVAELTAIGLALDLLDAADVAPDTATVLLTDSSYADGVLTKGWKAKANTELIVALRKRLKARPGARLQWVAGHVGLDGNERADALANRGVAGVTATTTIAP